MTPPPSNPLPLHVKVGYAFGSVAYGVKDNGFSVFLLLFYNQVLGLDPGLVGAILLVALLLDAVVDPVVGTFSDRTRTSWGRRHPWMYAAIFPMAICWTMLWFAPADAGNWLYAYLLVFAFLLRASISCYEVPALSVVSALSADYDERTSLTRWRFLFGWTGGLVITILAFGFFLVPEADYPVGQLNLNGYKLYAWTGAAFITLSTLVSALTTHRRLAHWPEAAPPAPGLKATLVQVLATLRNRAFLILLVSTLFNFICQGVALSMTTYLLGFYWGMATSGFVAYSLTLFCGVVGAFLLSGLLQSRMEKRTGAACAGALALIFSTAPYVLRALGFFPSNDAPVLIPVLFAFITIGNAFSIFSLILGQSMLSDVVEASEEVTGRREAGLFSAGYFFIQKCTTGLGIAISGLILTLSSFPKAAKPGAVPQPVLDNLGFYYALVIILFGCAAIAIITRFPITRADHEDRVRALAAGRAL
jgi:glycoside/pentoside/hexuronide:cation symporter, GPH family